MQLTAMKFVFALTALTIAIVSAGPPSSSPNDFPQYYLKTKVIAGTGPARFDGLYVYSYHVGAGLGDGALAKKKGKLPTAFLNGTYQQFKFDEGKQPYFPWGMFLTETVFYAGWQATQINTGYGTSGFFLNGTGLQHHVDSTGFGGWRVCDWWHQVPQLFWKLSYYSDRSVPSSCADVLLMPEYV